jgi:hypothetical protein
MLIVYILTAGGSESANRFPGFVVNKMYDIMNGEYNLMQPRLVYNGSLNDSIRISHEHAKTSLGDEN